MPGIIIGEKKVTCDIWDKAIVFAVLEKSMERKGRKSQAKQGHAIA